MFVSRQWTSHIRVAAALVMIAGNIAPGTAQTLIRLRNGLELEGGVVEMTTLNANAFSSAAKNSDSRPIWGVDDGLRRVFLHKMAMVLSHKPALAMPKTDISIWQETEDGGRSLQTAGAIHRVRPFNAYGRRTILMQSKDGPLALLQGITELTPRYAKVETLKEGSNIVWDMRLATSSIPGEELRAVLNGQLNSPNDLNGRLEIVRFFLACKMYAEAITELDEAIKISDDPQPLTDQRRIIVQQQALQILNEALTREQAGQRKLARRMLKEFPLIGVAAETKIQVEDALNRIDANETLGRDLLARLEQQFVEMGNAAVQGLEPLLAEMKAQLSTNSLARLDDYQRLGSEATSPLENRVALGLGGWLLGPGAGMQNLALVRSLDEVRGCVAQYLVEQDPGKRKELLARLKSLEGAVPLDVAKLLLTLPPPISDSTPFADPKIPGMYNLELGSRADGEKIVYSIQLPPEYDPLRRYPCIVALHPQQRRPTWELDWWAGPWVDGKSDDLGIRLGQASRHGFIVLAPRWDDDQNPRYQFTPREHQRVLAALRDANRRFSVDTDRVFIAGHADGATAAWDIAGAHPDLWAGMVAFGGESAKCIKHYYDNLRTVPLYFVFGELAKPLERFGATLDRYMSTRFNCLVVTYRGRGEEDFYEEIHHVFEWLTARDHRRGPPPREINAEFMRQGDQFFWWLEAAQPNEKILISPLLYEYADIAALGQLEGVVSPNGVRVTKAAAKRVFVNLSPEMGLDMQDKIQVTKGSLHKNSEAGGSLEVLLEDARTRADRQHPIWDRVSFP